MGIGLISQSARAHSAAESRFRVPYRNSRDRTASLIALDAASVAVVERAVSEMPQQRRAVNLPAQGADWLQALQSHAQALLDDADRSDLLVMVAHAGGNAEAAALLGEACRIRGVAVTALLIAPEGMPEDAVTHTLSQLRPFASMIVVAKDADYIEDMLRALRA
jgi:hypothetical protein